MDNKNKIDVERLKELNERYRTKRDFLINEIWKNDLLIKKAQIDVKGGIK